MWRCWAILLGAILFCANPVHAGIYNTRERPLYPSQTWLSRLREIVNAWRALPVVKDPDKTAILAQLYGINHRQVLDELEAKHRAGTLTPQDYVDLSACYLRFQKYQEAFAILKEASGKISEDWPGQFLLQANWASTYHHLFETESEPLFLDRAIRAQESALEQWPQLWPGWTVAELRWYQRAELYYYRLLKQRQAELRRMRPGSEVEPDDLFPGVRFLGASGTYEAGSIAVPFADRIPSNAQTLLIQLVFWRPFDDRIYWLLAEVFNAQGKVEEAYNVMDDLRSSRNMRSPSLLKHFALLRSARDLTVELEKLPLSAVKLLACFVQRGIPGYSVIGSACAEIVWPVIETAAAAKEDGLKPRLPANQSAGGDGTADRFAWLTRGRVAVVAFIGGVLLTLLSIWQFSQWTKRYSSRVTDRRFAER